MPRLIALLGCLLVPTAGQAASVFLNGVNIDGVANQVFENCRVEIDAWGNVRILAKGYAVQGAPAPAAAAPSPSAPAPLPAPAPAPPPAAAAPPPPATPAPNGPPTLRYFLVTEKAAPGMTQYDVDVFINSKWVRKFMDSEEHVVMELTKYLQAGPNRMTFLAKKNLAGSRRSSSPQHYFRIIVGAGDSSGRNVMISNKMVDYKRTALETKDYQDEFTLVAQ